MKSERPDTSPPTELVNTGWLKLSPRTVAANAVRLAAQIGGPMLVISIAVASNAPRAGVGILAATLVLLLVIVGLDWLAVSRTHYRLSEERLEVRSGMISHTHRAILRERIRSVDLTTDVVSRLFGLAKVTISAGQHTTMAQNDELQLEFVAALDAEQLRRALLRREYADARPDESIEPEEVVLAQLDWRWVQYAPLTVWTPVIGAIALGGVYQVIAWFGEERANAVAMSLYTIVWSQGWVSLGAAALVVVIVGVVATITMSIESWWGYRLERESNSTLRLRRGLLRTRLISLEERRLRGVELIEPMVLRWFGAAKVHTIATGLGTKEEDEQIEKSALTPEVPKREAQRVATLVLRGQLPLVEHTVLTSHPRAALRRRLVYALASAGALFVVLVVLSRFSTWLPDWSWTIALGVAPIAILYAVDAYRSLGHGLVGRYLVTRSGTFVRRMVVLRRDGVIGWRVKQSPFQHRSELVTLTATTAAGNGAYTIRDAEIGEGLRFAEAVAPGLMAPFIEHAHRPSPTRDAP